MHCKSSYRELKISNFWLDWNLDAKNRMSNSLGGMLLPLIFFYKGYGAIHFWPSVFRATAVVNIMALTN